MRAGNSRLVVVLLLIGWESGASSVVNQSQSEVKQRQFTFGYQLKTVLPWNILNKYKWRVRLTMVYHSKALYKYNSVTCFNNSNDALHCNITHNIAAQFAIILNIIKPILFFCSFRWRVSQIFRRKLNGDQFVEEHHQVFCRFQRYNGNNNSFIISLFQAVSCLRRERTSEENLTGWFVLRRRMGRFRM